MNLQEQFLVFHDRIKISSQKERELREKRDILLRILRNADGIPSFEEYNQGSYAMHLGVEPKGDSREYDIDVALRFNIDKDDYEPIDIKKQIKNVLENHTEYGAEIKRPCVTVTYKKDGTAEYHVDLVVYSFADKNNHSSQMYIALGKESNTDKEIVWEKADPVGLVEYINNKIENYDSKKQFRRIVKYLKRWKYLKFVNGGHGEPPSIGITLIVLDNFSSIENDDFQVLLNTVKGIQSQFKYKEYDSDNNRELYEISYQLPMNLRFEPFHNVFEKMSLKQMTSFKEKVDKLVADLQDVQNEPDLVQQCMKLQRVFGDAFNVPDAKDVSRAQINYIPGSTASGV